LAKGPLGFAKNYAVVQTQSAPILKIGQFIDNNNMLVFEHETSSNTAYEPLELLDTKLEQELLELKPQPAGIPPRAYKQQLVPEPQILAELEQQLVRIHSLLHSEHLPFRKAHTSS